MLVRALGRGAGSGNAALLGEAAQLPLACCHWLSAGWDRVAREGWSLLQEEASRSRPALSASPSTHWCALQPSAPAQPAASLSGRWRPSLRADKCVDPAARAVYGKALIRRANVMEALGNFMQVAGPGWAVLQAAWCTQPVCQRQQSGWLRWAGWV